MRNKNTDIRFTLYTNDCRENRYNTSYPYEHIVTSEEELRDAVGLDFVTAQFADKFDPARLEMIKSRRGKDTFLHADCITLDCDNDHSDDPGKWITPEVVQVRLPGVRFAAVTSRNHMKVKNGKEAREKWHFIFPTDEIQNTDCYDAVARRLLQIFPEADPKSLDAAHFFFGNEDRKSVV